MIRNWWKKWRAWLRGWFVARKGAIEPHPPLENDRGEREQVEKLMAAQSRHAGWKL